MAPAVLAYLKGNHSHTAPQQAPTLPTAAKKAVTLKKTVTEQVKVGHYFP